MSQSYIDIIRIQCVNQIWLSGSQPSIYFDDLSSFKQDLQRISNCHVWFPMRFWYVRNLIRKEEHVFICHCHKFDYVNPDDFEQCLRYMYIMYTHTLWILTIYHTYICIYIYIHMYVYIYMHIYIYMYTMFSAWHVFSLGYTIQRPGGVQFLLPSLKQLS